MSGEGLRRIEAVTRAALDAIRSYAGRATCASYAARSSTRSWSARADPRRADLTPDVRGERRRETRAVARRRRARADRWRRSSAQGPPGGRRGRARNQPLDAVAPALRASDALRGSRYGVQLPATVQIALATYVPSIAAQFPGVSDGPALHPRVGSVGVPPSQQSPGFAGGAAQAPVAASQTLPPHRACLHRRRRPSTAATSRRARARSSTPDRAASRSQGPPSGCADATRWARPP